MCFINIECIYFKKEIPPIIQIFVIIDSYTMVFLWGIFCVVSRFIKALNNTKLCFNHAYHLNVKFKFVYLMIIFYHNLLGKARVRGLRCFLPQAVAIWGRVQYNIDRLL